MEILKYIGEKILKEILGVTLALIGIAMLLYAFLGWVNNNEIIRIILLIIGLGLTITERNVTRS